MDDGAIVIRHGRFRRTTFHLDNEEDAQALYDCLARGIEESFAQDTTGWTGARTRLETRRIRDACAQKIDGLPSPPPLPPAPRADD